jgi:LacI family transcriptional regulator
MPPLSSIDPNAKLIGYKAAGILDAMMNNEPVPESTILVGLVCIVVRKSTDNIVVNDPVLANALWFIRTELASNLRVGDVAKELEVSRGTLNNLFQQTLFSPNFSYKTTSVA